MLVSSHGVPHELSLLIDFVNTRDVEASVDALDSPAALATWLSTRGLVRRADARADADDLAAARRLREALRAVLIAHTEAGEPQHEALATLDQVAASGELSVRFTPEDAGATAITVAPRADGIAGGLAAILAPAARGAADGTWLRVKACLADDCHWAFYDLSRNRSGRWCDMAVCGNRTKVRSYRARRGGSA